jgi:hypothetical protein
MRRRDSGGLVFSISWLYHVISSSFSDAFSLFNFSLFAARCCYVGWRVWLYRARLLTGVGSSFLPSEGGLLPSFGGGGPPTRRGRWEDHPPVVRLYDTVVSIPMIMYYVQGRKVQLALRHWCRFLRPRVAQFMRACTL